MHTAFDWIPTLRRVRQCLLDEAMPCVLVDSAPYGKLKRCSCGGTVGQNQERVTVAACARHFRWVRCVALCRTCPWKAGLDRERFDVLPPFGFVPNWLLFATVGRLHYISGACVHCSLFFCRWNCCLAWWLRGVRPSRFGVEEEDCSFKKIAFRQQQFCSTTPSLASTKEGARCAGERKTRENRDPRAYFTCALDVAGVDLG